MGFADLLFRKFDRWLERLRFNWYQENYPDLYPFKESPVLQPQPGEIWRHRKHNPNDPSAWHEYKIIGVSSGPHAHRWGEAMQPWKAAKDTETGDLLTLAYSGHEAFLMIGSFVMVKQLYVIYQSIVPEVDSTIWARPLDMFMDGRFTKVES